MGARGFGGTCAFRAVLRTAPHAAPPPPPGAAADLSERGGPNGAFASKNVSLFMRLFIYLFAAGFFASDKGGSVVILGGYGVLLKPFKRNARLRSQTEAGFAPARRRRCLERSAFSTPFVGRRRFLPVSGRFTATALVLRFCLLVLRAAVKKKEK